MTPTHSPGRLAIPCLPTVLDAFNIAPADEARLLLLDCLHSLRWAERVAAHRPYPTVDALRAQIHALAPHMTITVDIDIIRITPDVQRSN